MAVTVMFEDLAADGQLTERAVLYEDEFHFPTLGKLKLSEGGILVAHDPGPDVEAILEPSVELAAHMLEANARAVPHLN